jgi:hypothetical protein
MIAAFRGLSLEAGWGRFLLLTGATLGYPFAADRAASVRLLAAIRDSAAAWIRRRGLRTRAPGS